MGRTLALFLRPTEIPGERADRRRSSRLAGLAWELVALSALGAACGLTPVGGSEIRVQSELLPWANVSTYHTYQWWTAPIVESSGRYTEREAKLDWRVRQAVDAALWARGDVQDASRPDFVVTYHARVSQDYTSSFQDYVAYRAEGGTKDMGASFMSYERGTLMLEFTDARTGRVAWRATASTVIEGDAAKRIDPAVQQMIAKFPGKGS